MLNNNLSWINLNVGSGGGGTGGVSDYNDLANRPIKSLQGTSQNPISLWNLSTGLYLLNGYINYDVNNSREGVNLFVSLTAQMQNGQYVMSAFVPSWEAHYEYKKASANATDYAEHQMLKMLTQDEVLTMTNETPYTPTGDYNPSTKKYVDDSMNAVLEHLSELGVNKQDIQALITENRRRDIAIQALLNETADKNVTIEEETHTISLDYSIEDGMATVNKLEGSTLVNVSKQKEAIDITKSYDVETGNYIHLESEQDGKCKPLFEGNTAVNRAYGERNVVAMPKIESVGNNYHTITNGLDGGKVEVESVKGNTLVNLVELDTTMYNGEGLEWIQGNYIIIDNPPENGAVFFKFKYVKPNTVYTVCFEVLSVFDNGANLSLDLFPDEYSELPYQNTIGFKYFTFTTPDDVSTLKYLRYYVPDGRIGICKLTYPMVFEGDLTQTPELIPTEYVEGLKSSFENEYISQNVTYLQGNGSIREIYNSVATYNSFKPNTTYTYFIQNDGEEPARLYINSNSMSAHKDLTINENNYIIGKCVTKGEDLSNIWLSIRVTQTKPQNLKVYLLEGDWTNNPPTYEEVTNHGGQYRTNVKVVGKNKCSSQNINRFYYNSPWINGNSLGIQESSNSSTTDMIRVKPNTTYTFSAVNQNRHAVHFYRNLYDELPYFGVSADSYTFTTDNECNYVRLTVGMGVDISNIQLEEGTVATEYEPYRENLYQLQLNSPLLKDDEIRVQDGWLGHYHKMGMVVLDGSEDWSSLGTNYPTKIFTASCDGCTISNSLMCDTIPSRSFSVDESNYITIYSTINGTTGEGVIRIQYPVDNASQLKQWLQANPTTVVYELAKPYFEPLIKVDSLALDIYNTNSTISIDSTVPVQQSTVKNLSYRLQGHSSPYVLDYNADGEITHEIVDDRLRVYGNGAIVEDLMMFDDSEVPKSDYFQGLKSVFEEGLITDESDPNYGKYALELKSFTSNHVLGGTKVVYLSSPLLKGDSIEVIDGKLVHVHRYDMITLDGSEDENWASNGNVDNILYYYMSNAYSNGVIGNSFSIISSTLPCVSGVTFMDRVMLTGSTGKPCICKMNIATTSEFKQWLSENPTTVVYELAEPWNEVISENIDDITIDTYANGYLGLNTLVYPSNIKFLAFEEELTYLYTSSTYTVQFDSDGEGTIDIILGGASVLNKQVVKGKNNIQVTTPSTLADNKLVMGGYGNYKVSNVVVTNSTKEFDYFEGMKSTFEDTQNEDGTYNVEIVVYNAPVRFGKNNK